MLQMTSGRIMPRTELVAKLRAAGASPDQLIALEPLPGTSASEVLQVAVHCNGTFHTFKSGLRPDAAAVYRAADKETSRRTGALWHLILQQIIESGQTSPVMPGEAPL